MELQINDPHFSEKTKVLQALYQVLDPELMINIIDLGLVYDIDISETNKIVIIMTLTSKGCPLGEAIGEGVKNALSDQFLNSEIDVNIVWDPQWSFERISLAGREQLSF